MQFIIHYSLLIYKNFQHHKALGLYWVTGSYTSSYCSFSGDSYMAIAIAIELARCKLLRLSGRCKLIDPHYIVTQSPKSYCQQLFNSVIVMHASYHMISHVIKIQFYKQWIKPCGTVIACGPVMRNKESNQSDLNFEAKRTILKLIGHLF